MEIKIKIEGLAEAQTYFKRFPDKLKKVIKDILNDSALAIAGEAKRSPLMRVKTGRMRASVGGGSFEGGSFADKHGIVMESPFSVIVGPTVFYAKYVHRKYPFMDDAATRAVPLIRKIANKHIQTAI